jgi:hypothetical protein
MSEQAVQKHLKCSTQSHLTNQGEDQHHGQERAGRDNGNVHGSSYERITKWNGG